MADAATEDHIRNLLRRSGNPYQIHRDPVVAADPAADPASDDLILPPPAEITLPGVPEQQAPKPAVPTPERVGEARADIAERSRPQPKPLPAPDLGPQRQKMAGQRRTEADQNTPGHAEVESMDLRNDAIRRGKAAEQDVAGMDEADATVRKRAAIAKDRKAHEEWWAAHLAWQQQVENARMTQNMPLYEKLRANPPQKPSVSLEATGGRELAEIEEPVEATLAKVREADPAAAEALEGLDRGTDAQGKPRQDVKEKGGKHVTPSTDVLDANFAHLDPEERFHAMIAAGERLAATRGMGQVEVAGLPGQQKGGVGDNGTRLMPENRSAPRSSFTKTPRSPMEDPDTGGPRRTPAHVEGGQGVFGPRTAPDESTDALIRSMDLDDPFLDRREAQNLLYAAHQMGMDISGYGNSPNADRQLIKEAKRMMAYHQRQVGVDAIPADPATGAEGRDAVTGKRRIVGSGNPEVPYQYAETPAAKKARESQNLVRRTHEYIGHHPLPNTLKDEQVDVDGDGEIDEGKTLHDQLLAAAQRGDMEKYQEIRRTLRGHEIQGQKSMLVQNRKMIAKQHQMTDPRINKAVFATAMRDAGPDPELQAQVYREYGMNDQADRVMGIKAHADAAQAASRLDVFDAETRRAQAENGQEPVQADRLTAISNAMAPHAAAAMSEPGIGSMAEAIAVGEAAGMTPPQSVRTFTRQFMRQQGATAAHAVVQEAMRREWQATKTMSTQSYGRQFIENCVLHLGVSEQDALNWLRTHAPHEARPQPSDEAQAAAAPQ